MTGRRLLPKIGMRYKVLYILAFLLCANTSVPLKRDDLNISY